MYDIQVQDIYNSTCDQWAFNLSRRCIAGFSLQLMHLPLESIKSHWSSPCKDLHTKMNRLALSPFRPAGCPTAPSLPAILSLLWPWHSVEPLEADDQVMCMCEREMERKKRSDLGQGGSAVRKRCEQWFVTLFRYCNCHYWFSHSDQSDFCGTWLTQWVVSKPA